VPEKPSADILSLYTDSEGLFAVKIMELFQDAVILNTQLKILGAKVSEVQQPTIDDLTSTDDAVFNKYYKIAKDLENKVKDFKSENAYGTTLQLQEDLIDSRNLVNTYKDSLFQMKLQGIDNDAMQNMLDESLARIKELKDSLLRKSTNYDHLINKEISEKPTNLESVYISGFKFFPNTTKLETDVSLSLGLTMALSKLMGYDDLFDIFAEYAQPRFFVTSNPYRTSTRPDREEFTSNMFTLGANLVLLKMKPMPDNLIYFKVGGGFFWGSSHLPNTFVDNSNWSGETLRFELTTSRSDIYFPLDVFVAYSLNFVTKNINLPYIDNNQTSVTQCNLLSNVQLGIKLKLWNM
jgi:hypothetical protein